MGDRKAGGRHNSAPTGWLPWTFSKTLQPRKACIHMATPADCRLLPSQASCTPQHVGTRRLWPQWGRKDMQLLLSVAAGVASTVLGLALPQEGCVAMLIKRQVMQCRVQAAGPRCRSLRALRRKQTRQLPLQLASRACLRGPPAAPQPWPVPSKWWFERAGAHSGRLGGLSSRLGGGLDDVHKLGLQGGAAHLQRAAAAAATRGVNAWWRRNHCTVLCFELACTSDCRL